MNRIHCYFPASLWLCIALLFSFPDQLFAQKSGELPRPKNVIIMIGDGMGYNHILASNYYLGISKQVYETFPVRLASCHYPAKAGSYGDNGKEKLRWGTGYNTVAAWTDTAWLKRNVTESAASATALATGVKTYNNAIGISIHGDTLVNLVQWAKQIGKSAGVVTSVPFSHATPAGFVAHNATRTHYSQIACEMLLDSRCDVIMGCGNPMFDNNGKPQTGRWKDAKFVGDSALFSQLIAGSGTRTEFAVKGKMKRVQDCDRDGKPDAWTVVSDADGFRALMAGKTPKRVLGCPQVYETLQQARKMENGESRNSPPFITPHNSRVPDLSTMAKGAINVLDNNPAGFFLIIEGGAIDWAAHDNQKGRLIEEMKDFNEAVLAVVDWVTKNSSWKETLLVVTADHETGLLWGGGPFLPIENSGTGKLPGMKFFSGEHTQSLVPLFAKGPGCELYRRYADEQDSVRGPFIQQSEIPQLIEFLWPK